MSRSANVKITQRSATCRLVDLFHIIHRAIFCPRLAQPPWPSTLWGTLAPCLPFLPHSVPHPPPLTKHLVCMFSLWWVNKVSFISFYKRLLSVCFTLDNPGSGLSPLWRGPGLSTFFSASQGCLQLRTQPLSRFLRKVLPNHLQLW